MRVRILSGAFTCWARDGLNAATLDEVAREAGVARATIYRHFPGGRKELLQAVVSWEVGQFFSRLADDVAESLGDASEVASSDAGEVALTAFAQWVEVTLAAARRRVDQHELLHMALREAASQVVPALHDVLPIAFGLLREQVADRLEALPPAALRHVEVDQAADFVARMMLSFIGTPGSWRVEDPDELHRLVRDHLLAGILTWH